MAVTMSVSDKTGSFSVPAPTCILNAGDVYEIEVKFSPKKSLSYVEAQLELSVGKQGLAYQITLVGTATTPIPTALSPPSTPSPQTHVLKKLATSVPRENSSEEELAMAAAHANKNFEPLSILCDRAVIAWTGVAVKDTNSQVVQLRNNSVGTILDVNVSINKELSKCFEIGDNPDLEFLDSHTVVRKGVKYGETVSVQLLFTPRQINVYTAGLVVCAKPSFSGGSRGSKKSAKGKYTIPMVGYGGRSNVQIDSVRLAGDKVVSGSQLALHLGRLQPGKMCNLIVLLTNTGDRAAFVNNSQNRLSLSFFYSILHQKSWFEMCFASQPAARLLSASHVSNQNKKDVTPCFISDWFTQVRTEFTGPDDVVLPNAKGKVSPACLVIRGMAERSLRLTFRISHQDLHTLAPGPSPAPTTAGATVLQNTLAMIKVYSGDEIVRAAFKESRGVHPPNPVVDASAARPYLNYFDGEELIRWNKKLDMASTGVRRGLGGFNALQAATRCARLAITGAVPAHAPGTEGGQHSPGAYPAGIALGNVDVPKLSPARSTHSEAATVVLSHQRSPVSHQRSPAERHHDIREGVTYTLSPQRIKFTATGRSKHKELLLSNFGDTPLDFDVIVPSYALAVEPASGCVAGRSHAKIMVRTQPSFAGDRKPWIGKIFVLCNGTVRCNAVV